MSGLATFLRTASCGAGFFCERCAELDDKPGGNAANQLRALVGPLVAEDFPAYSLTNVPVERGQFRVDDVRCAVTGMRDENADIGDECGVVLQLVGHWRALDFCRRRGGLADAADAYAVVVVDIDVGGPTVEEVHAPSERPIGPADRAPVPQLSVNWRVIRQAGSASVALSNSPRRLAGSALAARIQP